MTAALGMGTVLDPNTIVITHHAAMRYLERRGHQHWSATDLAFAEGRLRDLLSRAVGQSSPVFCSAQTPSRRYVAGGFAFIVSANHSHLITFYPWAPKLARKRSAPRRWVESDESEYADA